MHVSYSMRVRTKYWPQDYARNAHICRAKVERAAFKGLGDADRFALGYLARSAAPIGEKALFETKQLRDIPMSVSESDSFARSKGVQRSTKLVKANASLRHMVCEFGTGLRKLPFQWIYFPIPSLCSYLNPFQSIKNRAKHFKKHVARRTPLAIDGRISDHGCTHHSDECRRHRAQDSSRAGRKRPGEKGQSNEHPHYEPYRHERPEFQLRERADQSAIELTYPFNHFISPSRDGRHPLSRFGFGY